MMITISDSKDILNLKEFATFLRNLKPGKHLVEVTDKRKRTLNQNAFYWSVIVPLCRAALYDFGWDDIRTDADAHEYLMSKFLARKMVNKTTGELWLVYQRTSKLTVPEMSAYIEDICRWAAQELEIAIPSPWHEYSLYKDWEDEIIRTA